MNGAKYLCTLLELHGTRTIFGLFGDIQTDFAGAVRTSKIHWVGVHNEKAGGFMADIFARISSKPGVVFSTLGPGATNLTSALANATQDRVPLIAISDQVAMREFNRETHQYIDLKEAFHPRTGITKKTYVVTSLDLLPEIIHDAYSVVQEEPKGAVHISFPSDLFSKEIHISNVNKFQTFTVKEPTYPDSTISYEQILKMLHRDKRCLVIAGGSIERSNAKKPFQKFIEHYNLPVLTTFRGKNVLSSSHPNNFGTISRHLGDVLTELVTRASFILTVGYDYNEGLKPSVFGKSIVINVNSFDNRVRNVYYPKSYFANLEDTFDNLAKEAFPSYTDIYNFDLTKKNIRKCIGSALEVKDKHLHPRRIIDAVNAVFTKDTIIVCDVGLNKYYSGLLLDAYPSNQILFSNGQSAMAFSSGALGAKIANPKKNVVVLVGDGGFLMEPQEVLTAVKQKKSIIWIIFNNGGLGLIEQAQNKGFDHTYGVHFSSVFFTKIAQAFGIDGIHLTKNQSLVNILKKYKRLKTSVIIDVPVQYAVRE